MWPFIALKVAYLSVWSKTTEIMQYLKVKVAVLMKEPTLSDTAPRTTSRQAATFEASLCL